MRWRLASGGRLAAALLVCAIVLGACSVVDSSDDEPTPTFAPTRVPGTRPFSERTVNVLPSPIASPRADGRQPMDAVTVVQLVGPAVVTVINIQRAGRFESSDEQAVGTGTGFIIDTDGH